MTYLNRPGVDIYYEVHGEGPPLLLTHGSSATSQMWQPQIEALSASHTLIIWDMRGHGRSGSPEDDNLYSEAHTVADMAALLDHHQDALLVTWQPKHMVRADHRRRRKP